MKDISNWTLVGLVVGVSWSAGAFIRYWVLFHDVDKMFAHGFIGVLICAVAWLYNSNLETKNTLDYMETQLQAKWGKLQA